MLNSQKLFAKRFIFFAISIGLVSIPLGLAADPRPEIIFAFLLDLDGNAFNLPTNILVYDSKGREASVSAVDFAVVEHQLGVQGTAWADFRLSKDPARDSFVEFTATHPEGLNRILLSFMKGLVNSKSVADIEALKGPSFPAFREALRNKWTAKHVWMITARRSSAESILELLTYLKHLGWIDHLPEKDHVWPVGHPDFAKRFEEVFGKPLPPEAKGNIALSKAAVMEQSLDYYEGFPLPKFAKNEAEHISVWNPAGDSKVISHLWGFSDDTSSNILRSIPILQKGVDSGRWSKLKITEIFTGLNDPKHRPRWYILRPGQEPRDVRDGETAEWGRLLEFYEKRKLARRNPIEALREACLTPK